MKALPDYRIGETATQRSEGFNFAVRFAFGMPFGLLVGFRLWREIPDSLIVGWLCLGGGALVIGCLSGWLSDRFWHGFLWVFCRLWP